MKTKFIFSVLALTFLSLNLFSQEKFTITGKVRDTNQKAVKGVSVYADGAFTGMKTDREGSYSVSVPTDAKKLKISSRSGQFLEQQIDGKSEINFEVPADFTAAGKSKPGPELSEDEVNIGYGSVKQKDLITPVTKVNGTTQRIPYKDIYEMLRGKPGVQVIGKNVKVQGGVNSINSDTSPLFVVDGIVVASIDDIIPQEVKSIEILKGPSASIYGSRGANGVILITLKK